ncbi:MAG: pilin [Desulfobacterota bacterium]|nr:pilin [Thermodesulfobacteriota bacterium]MDW8002219.1 pilin [Deltaproteobacteria bacterium]
MLKAKKVSKGFTLIELLIVIAIIGILAAIAIPAYTGYTKKSKISGVINAMGAVKNAVVAYHTEKGTVEGLNLDTEAKVKESLGISFPMQYAKAITVVGQGPDKVVITVTLDKVASDVNDKKITLTGENLGGSAKWTWGGDDEVKEYLPKG